MNTKFKPATVPPIMRSRELLSSNTPPAGRPWFRALAHLVLLLVGLAIVFGAMLLANAGERIDLPGAEDVAFITDGPDPVPSVKVTIIKAGLSASAPLMILDATGGDAGEAIEQLLAGAVDGVVVWLPSSACNDVQDCARESTDTCALLGGRATATTFSAASGTCNFTCSTGHSGTVACAVLGTIKSLR